VTVGGKPFSTVALVTQQDVVQGGWIHREVDALRLRL
jgi:hypothetical protein